MLLLGAPRTRGVEQAPAQEAEEHGGRRRRCLRLRRRQELAHDPVEAGEVAVLAEIEEEDLVQVAERRLRDDLSDHVRAALAGLGHLPLVELARPAQRLRPGDEPAAEVRQRPGLWPGHHLDQVEGVPADVGLDSPEVVQQDLAQTLGGDDLLGELASDVRSLDPLPGPRLGQLLVVDLVEERPVSHGPRAEEPVELGLPAVEKEERRRRLEVLAAGVGDELALRFPERRRRVQGVVALDLAEDDGRVPDQVEAVVASGRPLRPQAPHRERALLEEVLAVGLRARARRVAEGAHIRLEQGRVHVGLGEPALLVLRDVQAWQTNWRHRSRPPTVGRRMIRSRPDRASSVTSR